MAGGRGACEGERVRQEEGQAEPEPEPETMDVDSAARDGVGAWLGRRGLAQFEELVVLAFKQADYQSEEWVRALDSVEEAGELDQFVAAATTEDTAESPATDYHAVLSETLQPSMLAGAVANLRSVPTADKSKPRTDAEFLAATQGRRRLGESAEAWRERELRDALPKGSFGFTDLETSHAKLDSLLERSKERHPQLQEDHSYEALSEAAMRQYRRTRAGTPLLGIGGALSPRSRARTTASTDGAGDNRSSPQSSDRDSAYESGTVLPQQALWIEVPADDASWRPQGVGLEFSFERNDAAAASSHSDGSHSASPKAFGSPRSQELVRRATALRDHQSPSASRQDRNQLPHTPDRTPPSSSGSTPRQSFAAAAVSPTVQRRAEQGTPLTPSSATLSRALALSTRASGGQPKAASPRVISGTLSGRPGQHRATAHRNGVARSDAEVSRAMARARGGAY
jgi:hypothetical protein